MNFTKMDKEIKNEKYEISSWEDEKLDLKDNLLRGIYSYGFEQPSSIQKKLYIHLSMVRKMVDKILLHKHNLEPVKQVHSLLVLCKY